MHRYDAGEHIGSVLKNLGHEKLWEEIQAAKEAITQQDTHPAYVKLRDFQETLASIDLARSQTKQTLLEIRQLEFSIQSKRKQIDALQEILFQDFKSATERALHNAA